MLKSIVSASFKLEPLLRREVVSHQQIRTTFILKRRYAPLLHRKGHPPKTLKNKHYIYDLVEDTTMRKQQNINLILRNYVEGYGNAGDRVSVKANVAYNQLLLPRLAVYASPENLEKYKLVNTENVQKYSSATAQRTLQMLSGVTVSVTMNNENSWVLQPWHIKVSFRKCGYTVPEEAITIPYVIKGPDTNLEMKQFYVIIKVNNTEEVKVRCILHHWSTLITDRIKHIHEFWKQPLDCIYPEDKEIINSLPSVQKHLNLQDAI